MNDNQSLQDTSHTGMTENSIDFQDLRNPPLDNFNPAAYGSNV